MPRKILPRIYLVHPLGFTTKFFMPEFLMARLGLHSIPCGIALQEKCTSFITGANPCLLVRSELQISLPVNRT